MTTDNPVNGFPPPPPKGDEEAPELVQVGILLYLGFVFWCCFIIFILCLLVALVFAAVV